MALVIPSIWRVLGQEKQRQSQLSYIAKPFQKPGGRVASKSQPAKHTPKAEE